MCSPPERHGLAERVAQGAYGVCFYPWRTLVPVGLFIVAFFVMSVVLGAVLSLVAVAIEEYSFHRYKTLREVVALFVLDFYSSMYGSLR